MTVRAVTGRQVSSLTEGWQLALTAPGAVTDPAALPPLADETGALTFTSELPAVPPLADDTGALTLTNDPELPPVLGDDTGALAFTNGVVPVPLPAVPLGQWPCRAADGRAG